MAQFISHGEAADYLGVSHVTLWRMARNGELVVYQDPLDKRRKMYRQADLRRLKRHSSVRGKTAQVRTTR